MAFETDGCQGDAACAGDRDSPQHGQNRADGNPIQVVRCLAQWVCSKMVEGEQKRTQKNIYKALFMPTVGE